MARVVASGVETSINIFSIDSEEIARTIFEDIEPLALSILDVGLLHYPHCERKNGKVELISGSRRLTAFRYIYNNWEKLHHTHTAGKSKEDYLNITVILHENLDEGKRLMIEFDENAARKDLTIFEISKLYMRLYEYHLGVEGVKVSTAKDAVGFSQRNLATLMDVSPATVNRYLKYNAMCVQFPELQILKDAKQVEREFDVLLKRSKADKSAASILSSVDSLDNISNISPEKLSSDEMLYQVMMMASGSDVVPPSQVVTVTNNAQRVIDEEELKAQKEKAEFAAKLVIQRLIRSYNLAPFDRSVPSYETGVLSISHSIESASVDFIDIDSPYGINLPDSMGKEYSSTIDEYVDIPPDEFREFTWRLARECYRILKMNKRAIVWCHSKFYELTKELYSKAGFSVNISPVIWNKGSGVCRNVDYSRASYYDSFFELSKGVSPLYKRGVGNVLNYPRVPRTGTRDPHPAEHPIELMQDLLETYLNPNTFPNKVWVPFLGSGNTILAAANLNAIAFGCDISEIYRTDYIARIGKTNKQGKYVSYSQNL